MTNRLTERATRTDISTVRGYSSNSLRFESFFISDFNLHSDMTKPLLMAFYEIELLLFFCVYCPFSLPTLQ